MIRATICDGTGLQPSAPTVVPLREALARAECTPWVDLEAVSDAEATLLGDVFGFHPLAVEDALGPSHLVTHLSLLAVMVVTATGMAYCFKRRGWM